jgi:hypothetical protein
MDWSAQEWHLQFHKSGRLQAPGRTDTRNGGGAEGHREDVTSGGLSHRRAKL